VKIDINFILKKINELCQIKDEGSIIIEDYYHPTAFCIESFIKPENYKKKVFTKV
jgi:hypothetical protein